MDRLTKVINGRVVFPEELVGVTMTPDNDTMYRILNRLAAYEDTGLEPEQILELKGFTQGGIHKADEGWLHVQALLQAEQDGRLVVLPCGSGAELERDGHTFRADHWNHVLTAFRDAPETKSGKQVALFNTKEAESALKGGDAG